jgi:hypothetical protein
MLFLIIARLSLAILEASGKRLPERQSLSGTSGGEAAEERTLDAI